MIIIKKLIVSVVTICLLAVLAACGGEAPVQPAPEQEGKKENEAVQEKLPAETGDAKGVVAVVNGREVTQDEFEYFVRYNVDVRADNGQQITDWDEEVSNGVTVSDSVKEDALEWFTYAGAIHQQAARLGIELTDEDEAALEEEWKKFADQYENEEAAREALAEQHNSEELYRYIMETGYLSDKVFDSMYGKYGRNISDADCAVLTEGDGYLMAKHILLLTVKMNDDGTREPLTEEEKAEKLATIRELKSRVDGAEEGERQELFDELMKEHSEDTGLAAFPDGYLFQEGDMVIRI